VFGKPKAKVSTSDGIHLFEKSSRNILMIFYMYIQCIGIGCTQLSEDGIAPTDKRL
jgi:hypothetical protein